LRLYPAHITLKYFRNHKFLYFAVLLFAILLFTNTTNVDRYQKIVRFENYRFDVTTTEWGAVRELNIRVFRDGEYLLNIKQKIDGYATDTQLGDLNHNGSPEIYVYSCTYGSGSFGKVIGFEFYDTNFGAIRTEALSPKLKIGYMGHDSFKVKDFQMIRQFPIYKAGDANAQATGGTQTVVYDLKYVGNDLYLKVR
jgi:hypothetical protein